MQDIYFMQQQQQLECALMPFNSLQTQNTNTNTNNFILHEWPKHPLILPHLVFYPNLSHIYP